MNLIRSVSLTNSENYLGIKKNIPSPIPICATFHKVHEKTKKGQLALSAECITFTER